MGLTGYLIGISVVVIVVLEIVKLCCCDGSRRAAEIEMGSCMTIGTREVQEDQMASMVTEAGIMAVLADGAGKVYGGRIAAKTAVSTFQDIFTDYNAFNNPQYYFRKAFHCANREILKAVGEENRGTASVGCVLIRTGFLYYGLVGNVKICVFREGTLVPVSVGHTVAVMAEKKFQEGKISRQDTMTMLEDRRLYNYLGRDAFKDIEFFDAPIRLKKDDVIVLFTDGIYELLGFKEVEDVLKEKGSCQEKALRIIEKVNDSAEDDKDNASIMIIGIGNGAAG